MTCPKCGNTPGGHEAFNLRGELNTVEPKPGMYTVCIKCSTLLKVLESGDAGVLTVKEFNGLDPVQQMLLHFQIQAIKHRRTILRHVSN